MSIMQRTELSLESAMDLCTPKKLAAPASGAEWPKTLYHARLAPSGRTFGSRDEFLDCHEVGWSETPLAGSNGALKRR
jgi:hypothetical protein